MTKNNRNFLMGEGLVILYSFLAGFSLFFIKNQSIRFALIVSGLGAFIITMIRIIFFLKGKK